MKKKLLVLLMVLVLSAILIAATACNDSNGMFVKDDARDYAQVSANVTYAERDSQVTKNEVVLAVSAEYNYYYQLYYQNYGSSYAQSYAQYFIGRIEEEYDDSNESLAKTEAYTLKCLEELYKRAVEKDASVKNVSTAKKAYDADKRVAEIEKILSVVSEEDLIEAVEAYNNFLQTTYFDKYRKNYEEELEKSVATKSTDGVTKVTIRQKPYVLEYEVDTESLDKRGLIVDATYKINGKETVVELDSRDYTVTGFSASSEAKDQEITVTFGDLTDTFTVDIIPKKPTRNAKPTEEEKEVKTEVPVRFEKDLDSKIETARTTDLAEYKLLVEVKRRVFKALEDNHTSCDYWYLYYLKQQVQTCYQNLIGKEAEATVTEEKVVAEYQSRLASQEKALIEGTSKYSEIMGGDDAKMQIVHDVSENYFYVYNLLFKTNEDKKISEPYDAAKATNTWSDAKLEDYFRTLSDTFEVYISNPEYDKDAECEKDSCPCVACENYKGATPGACTAEDCTCVACKNHRFLNKAFAEKYAEKYGVLKGEDESAVYVFPRNENGTINVRDVMRVVQGELGDIDDTEGTLADRQAMLNAFIDWIYQCNDDSGMFTTLEEDKVGYGLSDKNSSYVTEFTALSRALATGGPAADLLKYEVRGTGVGAYGWCYTNYGIHFIMLSGYAYPAEYKKTEENLLASGYYKLPIDAIVDLVAYDATTKEGTLRYYIREDLKSEANEKAVNDFQEAFYQVELEKNVKIEYNKKVYKDILKQYEQ